MRSPLAAFQPLTVESVQTALSTQMLGRTLHLFDELPSTNTEAVRLAQSGAPHGTVIAADSQTDGRGRLGRHWYSPSGKNVYCSIILRFAAENPAFCLSWLPLISAAGVARTVQVVSGLRTSVKWPNDVLLGRRKLAGILCERAGTSNVFVVVGIEVNVNISRDAFPEELREEATSISAEAGRPFDRARLLGELLSELEIRYEALLAGPRLEALDEYLARCSTIGKPVRVSLADGSSVEGWADSIADDGALRVIRSRSSDGSTASGIMEIRAGDVVHLR